MPDQTAGGQQPRIADATRQEEEREAKRAPGADRDPTPEEEAAAERQHVDPKVRANVEEAVERGAKQKGEGRIP
jgi:hypothetical protein